VNSELWRPPAHRGPLIAAGAVVLAVGLLLEELRLGEEIGAGLHLLILAVATLAVLGLGLQSRPEDGRPLAYQSVLLVTGLLLLYATLLRLADVLGSDFGSGSDESAVWASFPPGTMTWTSLVLAGVAGWVSWSRRSAAALLIAALATGIGILAAIGWIFDAGSQGGYRLVMLGFAIAAVLGALVLRGRAPRHAQQLINAAGVAILVIPLLALAAGALQLFSLFGGFPEDLLPGFWEVVVLAGGFGLLAYGAVDRVPGAVWLGFANLVLWVVVVWVGSDATLKWWPLLLIVLGLAVMAAGLRPRSPLPPEPDPYRAGEQPLAVRADEEINLRVRDDSPPG
jgi:hypothetical protein